MPYKHCHTGWRDQLSSSGKNWSYSPYNSTCQQAQAVTHPSTNRGQCCLTCRIWLRTECVMPLTLYHFMRTLHESHTIDKWNLYCSCTIKYIFAGIRILRFDRAEKIAPQRHFFSGMLMSTKNVNLFGPIVYLILFQKSRVHYFITKTVKNMQMWWSEWFQGCRHLYLYGFCGIKWGFQWLSCRVAMCSNTSNRGRMGSHESCV